MTAPDPRLGEIEGRDNPFSLENTRAQMDEDRDYLLAELRKAQDALGRVEGLHRPVPDWDHSAAELCTECYDTHPCPTAAAVADATGGGE